MGGIWFEVGYGTVLDGFSQGPSKATAGTDGCIVLGNGFYMETAREARVIVHGVSMSLRMSNEPDGQILQPLVPESIWYFALQ